MSRTVVDCFIFRDELDMLDRRFAEMEYRADVFVIVEAATTFQGDPKPLVFAENRDRFARWSDRIVYVEADLTGAHDVAWSREHLQREHFGVGLERLDLSPDDVVVISDVDEMWQLDRWPSDDDPFVVCEQTCYVYSYHWKHPDRWQGPTATTVAMLGRLPAETRFKTVRDCSRHPRPTRVRDGGEHLTWFGGVDACIRKLDTFSHVEFKCSARRGLLDGSYMRAGIHIDGTKLVPA
jgi:beta-1,4-mannosyl-glycoprotein beta-1,4-N-acetylglucosaminyltransferase